MNRSIATMNTSPTEFTHSFAEKDDGETITYTITDTFGPWQHDPEHGTAKALHMIRPPRTLDVSMIFDAEDTFSKIYTALAAKVEVNLVYLHESALPAGSAQLGQSPVNAHHLRLHELASKAPLHKVTMAMRGGAEECLEAWLNDRLEAFDLSLSSVDR